MRRAPASDDVSDPNLYASSWNVFEFTVPSAIPRSSACLRSTDQSSTVSHGMCSATDGAAPVYACTCAASASFSCTVRGVPADGHTRNLVPEFPNAHDGSSIATVARVSVTAGGRSAMVVLSSWSRGGAHAESSARVAARRRGWRRWCGAAAGWETRSRTGWWAPVWRLSP